MELILPYFPNLTDNQLAQFKALGPLYTEWNEKINVISRKDIESLYEKHVLHSLAIGLLFDFPKGYKILDIGTGGGFPGIPLSILFPDVNFHLVDSIAKKITVVNAIKESLALTNVIAEAIRGEQVSDSYDVILARAVTRLLPLFQWAEPKLNEYNSGNSHSGLIALKGGDLDEEIEEFLNIYPTHEVDVYDLKDILKGEFFETKKLLHIHHL